MSKDNNGFLSFLIGIGTGIALGLLFAPKTGEETREDIKDTVDNLKYKVDDLYHRSVIKSTELYGKGKEKANELYDKGKNKANELYAKGKDTTMNFINKKNKKNAEVVEE